MSRGNTQGPRASGQLSSWNVLWRSIKYEEVYLKYMRKMGLRPERGLGLIAGLLQPSSGFPIKLDWAMPGHRCQVFQAVSPQRTFTGTVQHEGLTIGSQVYETPPRAGRLLLF